MDIYKKIKHCRRKLNESIKKYGLCSEITKNISEEINNLIQEYYKDIQIVKYPKKSDMLTEYKKSYLALKEYTTEKGFPTVKEWNTYAKKNTYLSHKSLEYINKVDWNYLQIKIERENNIERDFFI